MSQTTQEAESWTISPTAYEWFQEQMSKLSERIGNLEAKYTEEDDK